MPLPDKSGIEPSDVPEHVAVAAWGAHPGYAADDTVGDEIDSMKVAVAAALSALFPREVVTARRLLAQGERVPPQEADVYLDEVLALAVTLSRNEVQS